MWCLAQTYSGTAALTIDIPSLCINDGKIIGCGGRGSGLRIQGGSHPPTAIDNSGYSTGTLGTGNNGSAAINVTSSELSSIALVHTLLAVVAVDLLQ